MKDYNVMSMHGITDQDYVEEFGMPEELAGTPAMNDWMIDHIYKENITADTEAMLAEGIEPEEAVKKATFMAKEARTVAGQTLKKVTKLRGY